MINTLVNKIKNYKKPDQGMIQGDYYIEEENNITYLIHPNSIVAFLQNGKVIRLGMKCNSFEWMLHTELSSIVKNSNCRIETPTEYQIIDLQGIEYHYYEVTRPNNELGMHFLDEIETTNIDNYYFEEYIHDVTSMLKIMKPFCKKYDHPFLPRELLSPYKRNKDSKGYFWIDFKTWDFPLDKFIEKKIRTLYLTMITINEEFEYKKTIELAKKEWSFFCE